MDRLLRGAGRFTADAAPRGCLHAAFVRADRPGGVVHAIDGSHAERLGGIALVLCAEDIAAALERLRESLGAAESTGQDILAGAGPLYLGEPVALVVAATPLAALEGAENVRVEVAEGEPSRALLIDWRLGDEGETRRLIEAAEHRLTARLRIPRISPAPLEPAGATAEWHPAESRLQLTAPTQGVHRIRDELCALLGIPSERLRVRTGDVGGGFGGRIHALREQAALLLAARLLERPVHWCATRQESMVAEFQARGVQATLFAGFRQTGEIAGLAAEVRADCGASLSVNYAPIVTQYFAAGLCGPYAVPSLAVTVKGHASPRTPAGPFRGAGQPEGCYAIERVLDRAARGLGISGVEIRRRNLLGAGASTATGVDLGGIDPARALDKGAEKLRALRAAANRAPAGETHRDGFALSPYVKQNGMGRREECALTLSADGRIALAVGSQSNGQGHAETFERLVAGVLELDARQVVLLDGDTELLPAGTGTGGSAALTTTGAALRAGASALREKVVEAAAERLEVPREDVRYRSGECIVPGTDLRLTLAELAADERAGKLIDAQGSQPITLTTTLGCHAAWVSVDTETGAVSVRAYQAYDDVGTVLEPALLEAQLHGGLAQGIAQALGEQVVYDPGSGQLLSASFMDYWIPHADDLPFFALEQGATPAASPLGTRGAGEAGAVPAAAVIANAVLDALAPLGVGDIDLPLTSGEVWAALGRGRLSNG